MGNQLILGFSGFFIEGLSMETILNACVIIEIISQLLQWTFYLYIGCIISWMLHLQWTCFSFNGNAI